MKNFLLIFSCITLLTEEKVLVILIKTVLNLLSDFYFSFQ